MKELATIALAVFISGLGSGFTALPAVAQMSAGQQEAAEEPAPAPTRAV